MIVFQYDKLNHEAGKVGDEIEKIIQQGKAILPTVSEADKLTLSEQLNGIKDKHGRISTVIQDRSEALRNQIKNCKEAAAKVEECVNFMTGIQKELKELNRPVGSKVEDVQGMLASYEVCKSCEEPVLSSLVNKDNGI
jgi:nesprin-1